MKGQAATSGRPVRAAFGSVAAHRRAVLAWVGAKPVLDDFATMTAWKKAVRDWRARRDGPVATASVGRAGRPDVAGAREVWDLPTSICAMHRRGTLGRADMVVLDRLRGDHLMGFAMSGTGELTEFVDGGGGCRQSAVAGSLDARRRFAAAKIAMGWTCARVVCDVLLHDVSLSACDAVDGMSDRDRRVAVRALFLAGVADLRKFYA